MEMGTSVLNQSSQRSWPTPLAILELLKPITWFPPMWAFACGVIATGIAITERWQVLLAGVLLAGPMVCATSQAINDWFDRHVDAINEPNRPIPSGRMPGRWGLYIAIIWTYISVRFLVNWFKTRTLYPFAVYCFVLGLASVIRFS